VQLSTADINNIKQIVRTAPGHVEAGFRWPFEGNIGKFTSKDVKANLAQDFQPIMDGTHLENWRNFEGNLGDFNLEDLVEGTKVGIEYSPVPFGGRKATANDAGYDGGSVLANERAQIRSDSVPGLSVDTLGAFRVEIALTRSESDLDRSG